MQRRLSAWTSQGDQIYVHDLWPHKCADCCQEMCSFISPQILWHGWVYTTEWRRPESPLLCGEHKSCLREMQIQFNTLPRYTARLAALVCLHFSFFNLGKFSSLLVNIGWLYSMKRKWKIVTRIFIDKLGKSLCFNANICTHSNVRPFPRKTKAKRFFMSANLKTSCRRFQITLSD